MEDYSHQHGGQHVTSALTLVTFQVRSEVGVWVLVKVCLYSRLPEVRPSHLPGSGSWGDGSDRSGSVTQAVTYTAVGTVSECLPDWTVEPPWVPFSTQIPAKSSAPARAEGGPCACASGRRGHSPSHACLWWPWLPGQTGSLGGQVLNPRNIRKQVESR